MGMEVLGRGYLINYSNLRRKAGRGDRAIPKPPASEGGRYGNTPRSIKNFHGYLLRKSQSIVVTHHEHEPGGDGMD